MKHSTDFTQFDKSFRHFAVKRCRLGEFVKFFRHRNCEVHCISAPEQQKQILDRFLANCGVLGFVSMPWMFLAVGQRLREHSKNLVDAGFEDALFAAVGVVHFSLQQHQQLKNPAGTGSDLLIDQFKQNFLGISRTERGQHGRNLIIFVTCVIQACDFEQKFFGDPRNTQFENQLEYFRKACFTAETVYPRPYSYQIFGQFNDVVTGESIIALQFFRYPADGGQRAVLGQFIKYCRSPDQYQSSIMIGALKCRSRVAGCLVNLLYIRQCVIQSTGRHQLEFIDSKFSEFRIAPIRRTPTVHPKVAFNQFTDFIIG